MDDRFTTKYAYSLQGFWDYVAVYKERALSIFRYDEEAFDFEEYADIEDTGDVVLGVCFLPTGEFDGIKLAVLHRKAFRVYSISGRSVSQTAISIPAVQPFIPCGTLIFVSSADGVLIGTGCDLSFARAVDSYQSVALTLSSGGDYRSLRKDMTMIIKIFAMATPPRSNTLSIAFVQRSIYFIQCATMPINSLILYN